MGERNQILKHSIFHCRPKLFFVSKRDRRDMSDVGWIKEKVEYADSRQAGIECYCFGYEGNCLMYHEL